MSSLGDKLHLHMDPTPIDRALAAFNGGSFNTAEALCVEILEREPEHAEALLVLGNIMALRGDADAAWPVLVRARQVAHREPHFLQSLAAAFSIIGLLDDAKASYESALELSPGLAVALHGLGNVMLRLGDRSAARRRFEAAITSDETFAPAVASLADLAMRENRAEADALAARAVELAPSSGAAHMVVAQLEIRRRDWVAAMAALDVALRAQLNASHRAVALGLKGEALEGIGEYRDAFNAFDAANDLQRKLFQTRFQSAHFAAAPTTLVRLMHELKQASPRTWLEVEGGTTKDPVFLIGFPRSGTTLLGQILASHPSIETQDESENLMDATAELILGGQNIAAWSMLTPERINALRACYWRRVSDALGRAPARSVFVDKMPMNLVLLPLIYRLFPRAKVLLALRDPRDVVMSCFKQRFAVNAATLNFFSLETTVDYYEKVMSFLDASLSSVPLKVHSVRYERLVADFDATVRDTLSFLDLSWDDSVRSYQKSARENRILTPSAFQTTQPIYRSAVGGWRNYEANLSPYLERLAPWVAR